MIKRILPYNLSLLHVDHVKLDNKWNYKNIISPYNRIYYIEKGEGYISYAGKKIALRAGYIYIIPSFTLFNVECLASLDQYFIHFFDESPVSFSLFHNFRKPLKIKASDLATANIRRLLEINPLRKIYSSDNPKIYEKKDYYIQSQILNDQQSLSIYVETQAILLHIVSQFISQIDFNDECKAKTPSVILESIHYIQLNLSSKITVRSLADMANLQKDYFSRLFLKHIGERPIDYIKNKRIERAQYLMITRELTFSQIAEEVGFQNLTYFFRAFKKILSVTPGTYSKTDHFV